jgi:hypothetical protein
MNPMNDRRALWLCNILLACFIGSMVIEVLSTFHVINPTGNGWSLWERVQALGATAMAGGLVVIGAVFWGTRHFALFSRVDQCLTRWTALAVGILAYVCGSYRLFTRTYAYDRALLDLLTLCCLLAGSIMVWWCFLFIGKTREDPFPTYPSSTISGKPGSG